MALLPLVQMVLATCCSKLATCCSAVIKLVVPQCQLNLISPLVTVPLVGWNPFEALADDG